MKLSGNTVLITGGTSGIGLQTAKELLARGNKVIVTGRDPKRLEETQRALPKVVAIQSDAGKSQGHRGLPADRVGREFPSLNVLMNNAGHMRSINLQEPATALDELTAEIDTNLKGLIWATSAFLSLLKKQPEAALVNVSSGLAFVPLPIAPIYCATKAAVHSFSRSLRVQLRNTHVRVFELAPPATETNLFDLKSTEMEGVKTMKVDELVRHFLEGFEKNQSEIRPGQANQLKFMNRVAPEFIFSMLSKSVDHMHAKTAKS